MNKENMRYIYLNNVMKDINNFAVWYFHPVHASATHFFQSISCPELQRKDYSNFRLAEVELNLGGTYLIILSWLLVIHYLRIEIYSVRDICNTSIDDAKKRYIPRGWAWWQWRQWPYLQGRLDTLVGAWAPVESTPQHLETVRQLDTIVNSNDRKSQGSQ